MDSLGNYCFVKGWCILSSIPLDPVLDREIHTSEGGASHVDQRRRHLPSSFFITL
jgi:hypothetical protein